MHPLKDTVQCNAPAGRAGVLHRWLFARRMFGLKWDDRCKTALVWDAHGIC